jgi:hypothetical protein
MREREREREIERSTVVMFFGHIMIKRGFVFKENTDIIDTMPHIIWICTFKED